MNQLSTNTEDTPRVVRHTTFAWTTLVLSILGFIASATLVMERIALYNDANHVASCDFGLFVSCTGVMQSEQAALFGFPNPFIGIVAFPLLMVVGMAMLAGAKFARWFWIAEQVGITAGMGLVVFFWHTSVNVLQLLCPWCMGVWSVTIPLFILITVYNVYHGHLFGNISEKVKNVFTGWWWVVLILVYFGIVVSIFFRFIEYFI